MHSSTTTEAPHYSEHWEISYRDAALEGVNMVLKLALSITILVKLARVWAANYSIFKLMPTLFLQAKKLSSFTKLYRVMACVILAFVPIGFLSTFVMSLSLEYRSTIFIFLQCYVFNALSTFLSNLLEVSVLLAGIDRILNFRGSSFNVLKLYWIFVPCLVAMSIFPSFFNQR